MLSLHMPLQRRTQTLQNLGPVTEGSTPCFEWSVEGTISSIYSKLYTDCSPVMVMMVASAMSEFNSHFKHSRGQSSFIHIKLIILTMAVQCPKLRVHPAPGAHIFTAGCTIFGGGHPVCARFLSLLI